jgi:hypothetical protein
MSPIATHLEAVSLPLCLHDGPDFCSCCRVFLTALLDGIPPGSEPIAPASLGHRLLVSLTPDNFAVTQLLCRVSLDEEAYTEVLQRSGSHDAAAAAASAAAADAQKGAAAIADAEKRFVSQARPCRCPSLLTKSCSRRRAVARVAPLTLLHRLTLFCS